MNYSTPNLIGGNWFKISSGQEHSCGIKTDHSLWCWGTNDIDLPHYEGQLGTGDHLNYSNPEQIGNEQDWLLVSVRYYYTCGIKTDHSLWCWGLNSYGQIGNASTNNQLSPIQISF